MRRFGSDCLRQSVYHCIGINDDDNNDAIIGSIRSWAAGCVCSVAREVVQLWGFEGEEAC